MVLGLDPLLFSDTIGSERRRKISPQAGKSGRSGLVLTQILYLNRVGSFGL